MCKVKQNSCNNGRIKKVKYNICLIVNAVLMAEDAEEVNFLSFLFVLKKFMCIFAS